MSEQTDSIRTESGDIIRFTRGEIIQHWILFICLTGLAITGFSLFFSDTAFARWIIALEGGIETRGILHRIFAIGLMVLSVWQILYVVFTDRGHRQIMAMLPRWKDFRDVLDLFKYYLGRQSELPPFGRFTPLQKLQYWGAVVGSALMILTGLVLWLHTPVMAMVPKWVVDVTTIIHGYEGLILFMILFFWHFYIVHFTRGNFPLQKSIFNGRISRRQFWLEHRHEYMEIFGDDREPVDEQSGGQS